VDLNEPSRKTRRQCIGKQSAGGGLALKLRRDRIGDFSQQRILEACPVMQRPFHLSIEIHIQDGRCEAIRRQVDMQDFRHGIGDVNHILPQARGRQPDGAPLGDRTVDDPLPRRVTTEPLPETATQISVSGRGFFQAIMPSL
jgi:hypothetical protein